MLFLFQSLLQEDEIEKEEAERGDSENEDDKAELEVVGGLLGEAVEIIAVVQIEIV